MACHRLSQILLDPVPTICDVTHESCPDLLLAVCRTCHLRGDSSILQPIRCRCPYQSQATRRSPCTSGFGVMDSTTMSVSIVPLCANLRICSSCGPIIDSIISR